ncbi:hypothetical protein [Lutibacter sp.]|uniref:hypothetical protein n=1 Tax=Lutibacter sp. TaxID=1925666 RepID=UPI0025BEB1DA|nr:hypothetical protein [Lutibacter sp.]MCF6182659.1 hypothetical protein [Lutibacter sp.]
MKKICFVIPDGTGIRNYLYSELVDELQHKNCEIILLHSVSIEAIEEINKVHKTKFKTYKLPVYKESYYQKYLREVVCYARLVHNTKITANNTILNNWNPNTSNFKKAVFYKLVQLLGKYVSKKYKRILKFEKKYTKAVESDCNLQKSLLKTINPEVVFSTHQRAIQVVPLITAAKQLNISTVGAIFSWDNLPKARLTVRTDKYIVWSEYMKKELNLYYPEIKDTNINITGTPQFEFYYNNKFILNKKVFYNKYKLDASKKIICFSGDDTLTSPFDPSYLDDLADVIQKEKLNIQILLRRAPVDVSGRFQSIISKYPTIIKEAVPLWSFDKNDKDNWQIIYPTYNDLELLVSTAFYCDAVINVGSTMAHDFTMFNKFAIYINYNTINSKAWNIDTIYKFQHFKSMEALNSVIWLNSRNEIKKVLNTIFEKPKLDNEVWLDRIAEHRKIASQNIANTLISCT